MADKRLIDEPGDYILSDSPSGVSKITLKNGFLPQTEADRAFETLRSEIAWFQNSDLYGLQPRLTFWFGEHPYSYSGLTHKAYVEWHPLLASIRDRIQTATNETFNSVLLNLYRDDQDNVDWHSDDEPALRKDPYIASISLGAVREFSMRKKDVHLVIREQQQETSSSSPSRLAIPLAHGSLLIMEGSTQDDWQHRLPIAEKKCGPRINLTFRTIYAE